MAKVKAAQPEYEKSAQPEYEKTVQPEAELVQDVISMENPMLEMVSVLPKSDAVLEDPLHQTLRIIMERKFLPMGCLNPVMARLYLDSGVAGVQSLLAFIETQAPPYRHMAILSSRMVAARYRLESQDLHPAS